MIESFEFITNDFKGIDKKQDLQETASNHHQSMNKY